MTGYPGISLASALMGLLTAGLFAYKRSRYNGDDARNLASSLVAMNLWGALLAGGADYMTAHSRGMQSFLQDYADTPGFSLTRPEQFPELNRRYFCRDLAAIVGIVVSGALVHWFGCAALRCVEYISFVNSYKDEEAKPPVRRHKKSVSFDASLTTYSVEKMSTQCVVSRLPEYSRIREVCSSAHVRRSLAVFVLLFASSLIYMPGVFQLNTSSVWVSANHVRVTADNVVAPLVVTFVVDSILKLARTLNVDNAHHYCAFFPRSTQVVCKFVYFYICFLITCMFVAVRVSGDAFLNLLQGDIGPETPFWTVVLGNFLSHAARIESLQAVYDNMIGCVSVVSLFGFTILPLCLWVYMARKF